MGKVELPDRMREKESPFLSEKEHMEILGYCNKMAKNSMRLSERILSNFYAFVFCMDCKSAHRTFDGKNLYCDMIHTTAGNHEGMLEVSDYFYCAFGERKDKP